jgi:hypothetical protein
MSKRTRLSCSDCYFRRLELCALQTDAPCPTFRLDQRGAIEAPRQAPLVPRAFEPVSSLRLLPQHQAA